MCEGARHGRTAGAALAADIAQRHGGLDVLVVNGGPEPHRRLADLDEREWDRVIDAHVTQPFLLFKHLVPLMGPDRLGKVVVTTGVETARGAAKDLACEVAGRQVNVNVSCRRRTPTTSTRRGTMPPCARSPTTSCG